MLESITAAFVEQKSNDIAGSVNSTSQRKMNDYRIQTEQLTVDQLNAELHGRKASNSPPAASKSKKQSKSKGKSPSTLESAFDGLLANLWRDHPDYEKDYRFHPVRKWRIDRAFVQQKVAVELEGSIWAGKKGGHTSGVGFLGNMHKYNSLTLEGWKLLRYAVNDFRDRPFEIVDELKRALLTEVSRIE